MIQLVVLFLLAVSVRAAEDAAPSQDVGPDELVGRTSLVDSPKGLSAVDVVGDIKYPSVDAIPIIEPLVDELGHKPVPLPEVLPVPMPKPVPIPLVPIHPPIHKQVIITVKHPILPPPPAAFLPPVPTPVDQKVDHIIGTGKNVARVLTGALSAPVVLGASATSALVGGLPSVLAKKGAFLGALIATPIQWHMAGLSAIHSAANAAVVSVPVAIGTGLAVGAVKAHDKLAALHDVDMQAKVHALLLASLAKLKHGAAATGHFLLKPALAATAAKAAIGGHFVGGMGTGATSIGNALQLIGAKMSATGLKMKAASADLLKSSLGAWTTHPMFSWLATKDALPGQVYIVDTPLLQIIKSSGPAPLVPIAGAVGGAAIAAGAAVKSGVPLEVVNPVADESYFKYDTKTNLRRKRAAATQPILPLETAVRLMKLDEDHCIAKVICELSCDPKACGDEGKLVFKNLLSLQVSDKVRNPDFDVYRTALMNGRQFGASKTCQKCALQYPNCKARTDDLISVASLVKIQ